MLIDTLKCFEYLMFLYFLWLKRGKTEEEETPEILKRPWTPIWNSTLIKINFGNQEYLMFLYFLWLKGENYGSELDLGVRRIEVHTWNQSRVKTPLCSQNKGWELQRTRKSREGGEARTWVMGIDMVKAFPAFCFANSARRWWLDLLGAPVRDWWGRGRLREEDGDKMESGGRGARTDRVQTFMRERERVLGGFPCPEKWKYRVGR
jgi:hypothetical protein